MPTEPHEVLGSFIEVWGAQFMGGRQAEGNSSYSVDRSHNQSNTDFMQYTAPVTPRMLFRASGLGTESHTLALRNGGVNLYIAHFKVQDTESVMPTVANPPNGQSQTVTTVAGVPPAAVSISKPTGSHHYRLNSLSHVLTRS